MELVADLDSGVPVSRDSGATHELNDRGGNHRAELLSRAKPRTSRAEEVCKAFTPDFRIPDTLMVGESGAPLSTALGGGGASRDSEGHQVIKKAVFFPIKEPSSEQRAPHRFFCSFFLNMRTKGYPWWAGHRERP